MDVDVGNASNDQDVPAERLLHNLHIRLLSFVFVLMADPFLPLILHDLQN
jgi:hypothetical protein